MANKTFRLKLDLNGQTIAPKIEIRRNDHMTNVLSVQLLENGVPVDITGWTPVFECLTPAKTYVRDVQNMNVTDATNGKFEYTVTDNVFAVLGEVDVAYFAFEKAENGETLRFTTPNFYFIVIQDVMTGHDSVDDYMSDVLALIDEINDVKDDLQRIRDDYNTLDPENYATLDTLENSIAGFEGRNYIRNGDFSNGFENWSAWGNSNKEIVEIEGKKYVHLWTDDTSVYRGIRQFNIPLEQKTYYTLSFVAFRSSTYEAGVFALFHQKGDGDLNPQVSYTFEINEEPQQYNFTFLSSETDIFFDFMIGGEKEKPFDIYLTDIKLEKGTRATPYSPAPEDIESKLERTRWRDVTEPFYIAHRGGANIFPENTITAYEGCIAMGHNLIELDVQQLSDGTLAVMHDSTMDRTTNKSGNVSRFSPMGFKSAKVDVLEGFDDVYAPLFEDVLSRFGKQAIYVIESKDQKSCSKIVETLRKYRLEEYALIQSFSLSDLQSIKNEGIPLMYLTNTADPATIKSNNIQYVGVSTSVSQSYIQSCISAGLKVVVYTVNRRYQRDEFLALGVSGFFTNEPAYLSGSMKVLSQDPFINQAFDHGMIAVSDRGGFVSPNRYGFKTVKSESSDTGRSFCLQGWAGELPQTFRLTGTFRYDNHSSGGWGSIVICTPIDYFADNLSNKSSGYNIIFHHGGDYAIYRVDNGVPTLIADGNGTNAPVDGQAYQFQIDVTETSISLTIPSENYTVSANDTTYRGGYIHLGRRYSAVSFSDITIDEI